MKKQGFLYGSAVLVASALIVKGAGALFRIPLANMLGGEGMGYFSAAYGIFMPVYAVCATGLPAAVARSAAVRFARNDSEAAEKVRTAAMKMFGFMGAAAVGLIILLAYPFCRFVSGELRALPSVIAIAPSVLAGCLISVCRGYYEGMRNMFPTAVSQIVEGIAKLVLGLALCGGVIMLADKCPDVFMRLTGCGAEGVVPWSAAAAVMGVTLSSYAGLGYMLICEKKHSPCRIGVMERREICGELLATAIPAAAGALVTNLTSLVDLVTIMRSMEHTASEYPEVFSELLSSGVGYDEMPNFIYGSFSGMAVTLFNLVPSITNMFGKSMLPAAAAAKESGDDRRLGECSMGVLIASALISVPAGLGICVLSEPLLRLLFSGREAEIGICTEPMRVLGAAVPFVCISSGAFSILQAAGRADIPVRIMLVGAAVKLAGNIVLTAVPWLNVTGAAISTLLCYGVIAFISLTVLKRYGGLRLGEFLGRMMGILCSGMLCAAGAFMTYECLSARVENVWATLFSCLCGGIFYIISTYFFGIIGKSTLKMLIS